MIAPAERIPYHSKPVPVMLLVGTAVLVAVAYQETLISLISFWLFSDTVDYSHGTLLLALSIGLAGYKLWNNPELLHLNPSYIGVAALFLAAAAWGVATLLFIEVGVRLSFWLLFPSLVLALFGWEGLKHLWLPLLLPVFGIPVWSVFNEVLRIGTAHVVDWMLAVGGITTLLEGSTITLTVGKFYIADNCTGMRQLVVAMPLALLFAGWNRLKFTAVVLVFLAAVGLSFILNVIRILIVVVSGFLTDMQHYFVREDHVTLGWVLFGVGMLLFFFFVSRFMPLRWSNPDESSRSGGYAQCPKASVLGLLAVVGSMVLLTPMTVSNLMAAPSVTAIQSLTMPGDLDGWSVVEGTDTEAMSGFYVGADETVDGTYRDGTGASVFSQIALYRAQEIGREAVAWNNSPFDTKRWHFLKHGRREIGTHETSFAVREIVVVSATGQRRLIWTWYLIGGRVSASPLGAKLLSLRGLLCGRSDAAMIVVTHATPMSIEQGRESMNRFISGAGDRLVRQLEQAVGSGSQSYWCT